MTGFILWPGRSAEAALVVLRDDLTLAGVSGKVCTDSMFFGEVIWLGVDGLLDTTDGPTKNFGSYLG